MGFLLLLFVLVVVVVAAGSVPLKLLPATGPAAIDIHNNPPRHRTATPEGRNGDIFTLMLSL
jgi:hypothetical protein